ncbi:MAG: methyltransferase domain-containing protein [Methylococcales bacterium]
MNEPTSCIVTFYHDVEQNFDSDADPKVCRDTVQKFIALENRYGARATYDVVGKLMQDQPDLVDWILRDGHELAFHSCDHYPDWQPQHYAEQVAACRKLSSVPKGYRSPRSQWDRSTTKALWDNGFLWSAENEAHSAEPYFIYKGLVRLPIFADEWPIVEGSYDHAERLSRFRNALSTKSYVAIGLHDYIASVDSETWLGAWEQLLQIAVEHGALILTFGETADLYRRGAVSRHYDSTAQAWNGHPNTLYRTKRFGEMIRTEAEKLNRPVIADLASSGAVQAYPLTDIAARIYWVENSPGRVASIRTNDRIDGIVGELTATNLPDQSIDFLFCVNAVEYLFWPEHLADEIKRIAKPGATYLIRFPVACGSPLWPAVTPPGRIQHNFTHEEISEFVQLLGPGELVGIQYAASEPESPEDEVGYRKMESDPPDGAIPMFWVLTGKVERSDRIAGRRTIPLSACPFEFKTRQSDLRQLIHSVRHKLPEPIKQIARILLGRTKKRRSRKAA